MSKTKTKTKGRRQQREEQQEREVIQLEEDFERTFKPIFEEYSETGGMPLRILRQKLLNTGISEHVPRDKIELLLRKADHNRDGHINYDEFVSLVTQESRHLDTEELTTWQRMVRASVSTVIPQNAKRYDDGEYIVDDYISHYNCNPPPLFMVFISLTELIIFCVYAKELHGTRYAITATSGIPLYSPFIYNPSRRHEAWRYASYMFIHHGYMHLIFNLLFQLVLGIPLEMVHKWWRVGIVYTLGVIAGSMCHSVFDVNTMLAGASGGCYALIGAHFAIVIMNWKEMTHDWMDGPIRFISSAPVRLFLWTTMAGIDTGIAIWNRYHMDPSEKQNVGYAAHFGGALAGLLIGIPVLKNIDEKPWEKVVWWVALVAYLICVAFAIGWNTFYPKFPETDWRKCCPMPRY